MVGSAAIIPNVNNIIEENTTNQINANLGQEKEVIEGEINKSNQNQTGTFIN